MKCLLKFNSLHPSTLVAVSAKEHDWKIDISGKWLYKLNIMDESNIEVYFRVYYTNAPSINQMQKLPFDYYISNFEGFSAIFNNNFPIPKSDKYFNIGEVYKNLSFVKIWENTKESAKPIKHYILKGNIKGKKSSKYL